MKADELAALLQKIRRRFLDSATSIRRLIESAGERARTDCRADLVRLNAKLAGECARADCRAELVRLDAKLDDPAINFRGAPRGAALRYAFDSARGCLKTKIAALAKPTSSVQEALDDARAVALTVAEELDSIVDFLKTAPLEEIRGK
jgi:hypothetical protein